MTSWNGNIFCVTGPLWGNSPVTSEFPSQRSVTRSLDVFFDLGLDKRLSKQSGRRWFETPWRSLWHGSNGYFTGTGLTLQIYTTLCYDIIMVSKSFGPRFNINSLRPRQNGCHFADDTFKRIFLNENVIISIKISLKFVPKGPINNNPALVQIMAWRRSGDKPLSEPTMVSLLTHICVAQPQWFKTVFPLYGDSHVKYTTFARPSYLLHGTRPHLYFKTAPCSLVPWQHPYMCDIYMLIFSPRVQSSP